MGRGEVGVSVTACIELRDIVKIYRMGDQDVRAVDGVSFSIDPGEMVALMGASGSGKTTLMNILGCLDRPTSGQYLLEGQDVSRLSDNELARIRNRKIGFVFQNFNLLPRMTALENVELPLLYAGYPHAKEQAIAALERVGLRARLYYEPNQLSGGQRQRVAIARALVTNPTIILADEPTGNLDSRTSVEIMDLFAELNCQGVTLVIVTHEPDIADWCRRIIHIRDGKVISDRAGPGRRASLPARDAEAETPAKS